ncbi:ArdC family protein [Corynebacterium phoceense]|uniref:ArdC family protein n=1 Tax=Corynebacterium phoceense TaxID=1686286 RepID=UPI00211CBFA5|nr:ArdC family protein [Corynebacterium phoceense]MCQ9335025.1 ArdC family protein [Corynebacterium phoceense]
MQQPEGWRAWLDVASQLPNYSVKNQVLLLFQADERNVKPRGFASFKRWKELGYPVEKGEKSYRIYGPVLVSKPHDKETGKRIDDEEAEKRPKDSITWKKIPVAYKPVPTFGIEQTSAKDLGTIPDELRPQLLHGLAPDNLVDKLTELAQADGAELTTKSRAELGTAHGYYLYEPETQTKKIVVADDLDDAAHAKTLIHEIAHMKLHTKSDKPRELKEIEAESTAYLVAGAYGLDTSSYTFPYVAGWSGWDTETVEKTAETVRKAAGDLLKELDQDTTDTGISADTLTQTANAIDNLEQRTHEGPAQTASPAQPQGLEDMSPQARLAMQTQIRDTPSIAQNSESAPTHQTETAEAPTL